jgi:hypothetical protein
MLRVTKLCPHTGHVHMPRIVSVYAGGVGFFGRFVYSGAEWRVDPSADGELAIDIHDSDIATVDFRSAAGEGRLYLGVLPGDYFGTGDDDVDPDAEAAALAAWAREALGAEVTADEIRPLLAEEGDVEPVDDFVEETVARLIRLLGLPLPDGLD